MSLSVLYTGGCLSLKAMMLGSLCFIQVGECILSEHYTGESVLYTGGCLSLNAMMLGSLCFIQVGECILSVHYTGESVCTLYRWVFESEGHDVGFTVFYAESREKYKRKEMSTVVESMRCDSHVTPEYGNHSCERPGVCECLLLNKSIKTYSPIHLF